ncbi:ATP-binding cassette domain-containing protein [Prauserella cavernicola]|uniref:ABC transporter ATP-binding protein n=1 Tax=Prauserella cavernicola TaxID=2800127 RepID=A0A934QQG5_9PSEU|nr:dipeptide/oligopeptide/nickel ABC transporter ATP-binding protein [Prauserella cavernicola]MBK1783539.1 ABC transporter ATP-binding protein [Prauserella cavernicola]
MTAEGLSVEELTVRFGRGARATTALDGVSVAVPAGHTVGLVGESGSGKSTLAKAILGIVPTESGRVLLDGTDVSGLGRQERRAFLRRVQLIPQDPYSSLNPRRTIGQTLAEALDPARARVGRHTDAIHAALEDVALPADAAHRYPHEFSGGQRQRIAIARALVTRPEVVIADEITSALDVSVQAEVLSLLARLRQERDLTMLFISHNLAVVEQVSDEVVVLHHGHVVESGTVGDVFADPASDYTRSLLAAVPGRRDSPASAKKGAALR